MRGWILGIKVAALVGVGVAAVLLGERSRRGAAAPSPGLRERIAALEARCGKGSLEDLEGRIGDLLETVDDLTARIGRLSGRVPGRGGASGTAAPAEPVRPARAPIGDRARRGRERPGRKIAGPDRARAQILTNVLTRSIPGLSKAQRLALLELMTDTSAKERAAIRELRGTPDFVQAVMRRRGEIYEERDRRARGILNDEQFEVFVKRAPRVRLGAGGGGKR